MRGKDGHCPRWYDLIRSAKYLGVAPWDLLEQPVIWMEWAREGEKAEAIADEEIRKNEERKASKGRRTKGY